MMDARHARVEILERLERPFLALLQDRPHRLLPEAWEQFGHVEPRRDRLRAVEEVDELLLLLLHDLLDHKRHLLLRRGRQLLVADPALAVEGFGWRLDFMSGAPGL